MAVKTTGTTKMITNFDEFYEAIKASDYEMTAENLSMAEATLLKVLVSTGTEEQLAPAIDVLSDYYGIEIPRNVLVELLQANLDLAMETFTGGISDTCQRELLAHALLRKIGAPEWPCYGDSKEAYNKFIADLPGHLAKVGGKVVS